MVLNRGFHVPGKVSVDGRRRVLGQQGDALGDGSTRRYRRMDHRHRQLAILDHDFRTRAHMRQQPDCPRLLGLRDVGRLQRSWVAHHL
jgi:hypothetical protein